MVVWSNLSVSGFAACEHSTSYKTGSSGAYGLALVGPTSASSSSEVALQSLTMNLDF